MDTIDRSDPNVPARFPGDSSRLPAPIPTAARDLALTPPAPAPFSVRVILRGLSRHWWRILLIWLVVSTPLAFLIYELVEPTFEAVSVLRVEPVPLELFVPGGLGRGIADQRSIQPYLQTQVEIIKSDSVLVHAITRSTVVSLPRIKDSDDPVTDLRNDLAVDVARNTFLIRVALESRVAHDAADVVNAVVESYLKQHGDYHKSSNAALKKSLEKERDNMDGEIRTKTADLKKLVDKGTVDVPTAHLNTKAGKDGDVVESSFLSVTETLYARVQEELLQTDLQVLGAQADLEAARQAKAKAEARMKDQPQAELSDDQLDAQIEEEFRKDPDVAEVSAALREAEEQLEKLRRTLRGHSDPSWTEVRKHHDTLQAQYAALWNAKYPEIKAKLTAETSDLGPDAWEETITELQAQFDKLKRKQQSLKEQVNQLKVDTKNQNNDTLEYTMLSQHIQSLHRMQELITQKLRQLEFEMAQDNYRVSLHDRARVPLIPSHNKRLKYMAAAPAGILFLMLGLFLILEIKAERVGDPEALSSRMQAEVYALPPLPTARSLRKRGLPEMDDQIEQFIQRLDHLRFAVCGNPAELQKGRCVLITSAIGGEGKTTLAAQLAARCGHAGMSTLLMDADLRRTGLCALLDVPEGPGLSDALLHDEPPAAELVIPVQGGTFHLLAAGTPVQDTSRALENRKLGLLITQFRQLYDLVIIDSPPVLPVPDALVLGRWVDGAVLAVRYDVSRFPQVERARRQLDSAGIAVLGTVINGMRHSDSYYGRYSYSRRRLPRQDPDPSAAI